MGAGLPVIAIATSASETPRTGDEFVRRESANDATGRKLNSVRDEEAPTESSWRYPVVPVNDGNSSSGDLWRSAGAHFRDITWDEWARSLQRSPDGSPQFIHHDPPGSTRTGAGLGRQKRRPARSTPRFRRRVEVGSEWEARPVSHRLSSEGKSVAVSIDLDAEDRRVLVLMRNESSDRLAEEHGVRRERAEVLPAGVTAAAVAIVEYYDTQRPDHAT